MQKLQRMKARLRLVLVAAIALGCSSATLGGVLTALMFQDPTVATAFI